MALRSWLQASRPKFNIVTIIPVTVGLLLAALDGFWNSWLAAVTLIGALALHFGTNLANDYYDYVMFSGDGPYTGGSGVIQEGKIAPETCRNAAWVSFAVSGLTGVYLASVSGWPVLVFTAIGLFSGIFYTTPPIRYGYHGFGELFCGISMGPVIVLGTYFVQTGSISAQAVAASLPIASFVALILFAESIHDIDEDLATGKHTLASRLGEHAAINLYYVWIGVTAAAIGWGISAGHLPLLTLVVVLPLLPVLRSARSFLARRYDAPDLYRLGKMALRLYLATGVTMVAGYAAALA